MHMAQESDDMWGVDYRGKTVVVATHIVVTHIEQIREELRAFVVEVASNLFKVNGFVLGKVVDVSVHGQYWVDFPWSDTPVQVQREHVVRILLDDEGEPDLVDGLPKLV